MRNLSKFLGIGLLAISLSACGDKGPKDTKNPDGTTKGPGGNNSDPAKASAEAKEDFAKAVATYKSAKADGKVSGGECDKAAGAFTKVYKTHGKQMAVAQFNAGAVWHECGDNEKAEKIYREVMAANPKYDLPYNNLGVIYWKKGQQSKALDMFRKGVKANRRQAKAARNNVAGLARNVFRDNQSAEAFKEAESSIQTVLALDSNNQVAYENLARLYYDRGLIKDKSYFVLANLVVNQGIRVLKDQKLESAALYNINGLLILQQDDQVNALKSFKEATRVEPNHSEANLNIGFISIGFRDYAQAEKSFQIALKNSLYKKNIEAHIALGVAQRGLKKLKAAEKSYNTASKINSKDPRPYYNLGILYQEHFAVTDDVDEAGQKKAWNTAKKHYNKFISMSGGNKAMAEKVLIAKDSIANIDESFDIMKQMKILEAEAAKMAKLQEEQDRKERERLLKLEQQAMDAANAPAAPPADAPK